MPALIWSLGVVSNLLLAPRTLKEPVGWAHSSFSQRSAGVAGVAIDVAGSSGVRRTNCLMRLLAASISDKVTTDRLLYAILRNRLRCLFYGIEWPAIKP